MINDIEQVLITEEEIKEKIKELGEKISNDYKDSDNLLRRVKRCRGVYGRPYSTH